jgi:hypothetical protein
VFNGTGVNNKCVVYSKRRKNKDKLNRRNEKGKRKPRIQENEKENRKT